jgi:hypothetical protein
MSSGSGDAADYRAGSIRKASIAPWLFDWPTPEPGDAGRLLADGAMMVSQR